MTFRRLALTDQQAEDLHLPPEKGAPRYDQRVLRTQPDEDISRDPDTEVDPDLSFLTP